MIQFQYVAEQITDIAPPGTILQRGRAIARDAASGTSIVGSAGRAPAGVTLARATTGYEEGRATPAGWSVHAWLDSLGATAGSG